MSEGCGGFRDNFLMFLALWLSAVCQHAFASRVSAITSSSSELYYFGCRAFLNHLFPQIKNKRECKSLANYTLHTIPILTHFALGLQRPPVAQSSDGWLGPTFYFGVAWAQSFERWMNLNHFAWRLPLTDLTGSICRSWWRCQFATREENCREASWTCNSKKLLPQHPHQSSAHQWPSCRGMTFSLPRKAVGWHFCSPAFRGSTDKK